MINVLEPAVAELARNIAWSIARGELTMDERRVGAFLWRGTYEPREALTVFCADPPSRKAEEAALAAGRKVPTCGDKMAKVWTTPYGYIMAARLPVSHARTMHGLQFAMRVREEEEHNEELAQYAEKVVQVPAIVEFFLSEWDSTKSVPVGCKRRHGYVGLDPEHLLTLTGSTRRSVNVRPSSQFEDVD